MMRLLHVVPSYWPAILYGGPIQSVHGLCRALVRRGHEVHVVTSDIDGKGNLDVPIGTPVDQGGVAVHYFPVTHLRRLVWAPQMADCLTRILPGSDFLHLHSIFLWPTWKAARLAERLGIPWCIAPRGALVPELVRHKNRFIKQAWLGLIERRTLENASFLHATSDREAADAERFGYKLAKIEVVPNGVDTPQPTDSSTWPKIAVDFIQGTAILLFLGRINWEKGLDRLIPALAFLPQVRLIVAGNDEENLTPKLEALARSAGVADRVLFVGHVQGEVKAALMSNSDLLILPSYSENFGNVILESLASGRPVAMTAEVGLAPVVEKAGVGVIVPGEPAAMAASLAQVLADRTTLDTMGAKGRQWVADHYSWDAIAEQMESAYLRALEERRCQDRR